MPQKAVASTHQLKVTLEGTKPPVWRRIQVPSAMPLRKLHEVLQVVMGWENCHLYQFEVGGQYFGEPDPYFDRAIRSARATPLRRVAPQVGNTFIYEYDFGDSWSHKLVVEKVLAPLEGVSYPRCLAGNRACPPEDCGGIWGYAELLDIIRKPRHPEYARMREWLGGEFDPEAFDLRAVNDALTFLR